MVADNQQQNIPSQPRTKGERFLTGFAMLGGPFAWAIHLCVMYFLVQPVCRLGGEAWFHVTTAAMLLVCIGAAFAAWKHRQGELSFNDRVDGSGTWRSFVAIFGLAGSAIFAYAILYQWFPVLTIAACEGMRT